MIRVRAYREADFARVHAICVAAFAPIHAGFERALGPALFAARFGDWRADYARTLREAAQSPEILIHVAEEEGAVVAFVLTTVDQETGLGEIGLNAVDPPRQRRGIGRTIYRFALADLAARGARFAYVGTGGDAAHAPARAAYAAAGFDRAIPAVHYYRELRAS